MVSAGCASIVRPMKHLRVARRGPGRPRPATYDAGDYQGRNVIERSFNETKQWRGLATRYDKLALTYRGGAVLRAIMLWLDAVGDSPRVP
ncbi:transposase [Rhodococcus sp. TAF43]